MRHPNETDLLSVPVHRADREPRAEDIAVLSAERALFLEFPFLDRFLEQTGDEGGHVLRQVEGRDAQFPDDLGGRPSKQLSGVRGVLVDDSLHVARDDRRLRAERLLGHGALPGHPATTRISEFWFT